MPRPPRTDFPGAWHHVMHRGARRAPIFREDDHCWQFLHLLQKTAERHDLEVHAYSLMPNHYHLLVRSVHGNLSAAMRQLNGSYTQAVNAGHGWDGPVFRGRFRSQLIEDESRLPYVLAYIHLNPLRANLVTRLDSECWTSHRSYLGRRHAPTWFERDHFLTLLGGGESLQQFVLDLHRGKLDWPERFELENGWWRAAQEKQQEQRHAKSGLRNDRRLTVEETLILVTEITGIERSALLENKRGRGGNPARRFAAWLLWRHTLATQAEIGVRLAMPRRQVETLIGRFDTKVEQIALWIAKRDDLLSRRGG